jgi:hypothetical protein
MPLMNRRHVLTALVPLVSALGWRPAAAQVGSGGSGITQTVGSATLVVGSVTLRRGGQPPAPMPQDAPLLQGDQIETAEGSEAHIVFEDGGVLALRPNSIVRLDQYVVAGDVDDSATINLLEGALRSVTGWIGKLDPARYRITAGTSTIGVRGTDHDVAIVQPQDAAPGMEAGVHDRVNDGATVLSNANGEVNIVRGAAGYTPGAGQAPVLHTAVPAFFNRLRSEHDRVVDTQSNTVRQRMEERLRARGKLGPNEHFDSFRKRQSPLRQRRVGLDQRANPAAAAPQSPVAGSQAPAGRQAMQQEQREARLRARQERQAERRLQKKPLGRERKLPE